MDKNEAITRLDAMTQHDDIEEVHFEADDILCDFLAAQGFDDVAKAFRSARARVGFWYS